MTAQHGRSTSCRRSPTRLAPEVPWRWTGSRFPEELLRIARWRSKPAWWRAGLTPAEFADLRDEALEHRIDPLGDGKDSLYAIGPSPQLHGRRVHVYLGQEAAAEATIVDGVAVRNYDPVYR